MREAGSSDLWNPPAMVQQIQSIVESHPTQMVAHSLRALFVCSRFTDLTIKPPLISAELHLGGAERISLAYLRDTLNRCASMMTFAFLRHVFENLVLSQHFSVAARRFEARPNACESVLRKKGCHSSRTRQLIPSVTPDRLATALSLMVDCGLLSGDEEKGYSPSRVLPGN